MQMGEQGGEEVKVEGGGKCVGKQQNLFPI